MTFSSSQRGYTLLFAVLTATLVLGVTVFILSVSRKQFQLSATARDSTAAIYAADSGIECLSVIASDLQLSTSAPDPSTFRCNRHNNIEIDGVTLPLLTIPLAAEVTGDDIPEGFDTSETVLRSPPTGSIYISLKQSDGTTYGCARVSLYQGVDEVTGNPRTVIQSRGYNLCDDDAEGPDLTSPRTVERELELTLN